MRRVGFRGEGARSMYSPLLSASKLSLFGLGRRKKGKRGLGNGGSGGVSSPIGKISWPTKARVKM